MTIIGTLLYPTNLRAHLTNLSLMYLEISIWLKIIYHRRYEIIRRSFQLAGISLQIAPTASVSNWLL